MSRAKENTKNSAYLFWTAVFFTAALFGFKVGGATIAWWAVFMPMFIWLGLLVALLAILGVLAIVAIARVKRDNER